jgi:hypothetical protein
MAQMLDPIARWGQTQAVSPQFYNASYNQCPSTDSTKKPNKTGIF